MRSRPSLSLLLGVLLTALDHDLVMDGCHDMRLLGQPPV